MRNDEWVLGVGFWVLVSDCFYQHPELKTQNLLPTHYSSLRIHHSLSLLREYLRERRQKLVVLFGRADAQAEVVFEHRVAAHVADEYVAREQLAEDALRLDLRAHDHEVRVRADGREARHAPKVFVEPPALLDDAAHGRGQLRLVELDGDLGGGLREGVEVVRQHGLRDLARQVRRREQ